MVELAENLEADHGVRIRRMSRRRLRRELDLFGETYNEAWKDNWGFVPYSKRDLDTTPKSCSWCSTATGS